MSQEQTQQNSFQQVETDSELKLLLIPAAILGLLVIVVILASYINYETYFFTVSKKHLELWHGDFAPVGTEICRNFEPIPVANHDFSKLVKKKYTGKERAYGELFEVFVEEVEDELDNGHQADFQEVGESLDLADRYLPFCFRANPGYARDRFEISWKRVEAAKDLLSSAYSDSLKSLDRIRRVGVIAGLDIEKKEKEAKDWLTCHPVTP